MAEAIHAVSGRSRGPLVKTNCAAFAEQLLESELFGHVRGAFTGAIADRPGYFEAAQGGTLFLDEIGDVSCATQVRLLRLLEEKRIQRLGSSKTMDLDIRVIAATNKDLAKHVDSGQFRADLFYRLNYMLITVPPLRERREDIPLLVEHFMRHLNRSDGANKKVVSPQALDELIRRPWQGNVRELKNIIERAFVLCRGECIDVDDLTPDICQTALPFGGERRKSDRRLAGFSNNRRSRPFQVPHPETNEAGVNNDTVLQMLEKHRWHIGRTADALNIHRTTLWRYMQRNGLRK